MYIEREISNSIKELILYFSSLLLTGPRQSGKTTLLKHLFPNAEYVSFDDPIIRIFAKTDPKGFLGQYKESEQIILDEIQYVPELFSYLKMIIDENRDITGKWILTGSQQFGLMKDISDSLAGRIVVLSLLPFSYSEIKKFKDRTIKEYLWKGSYPEVTIKPNIRDHWLSSYIQTYLERDVRQIVAVESLTQFQNFIAICASIHSQELNLSKISNNCGIAIPSVKRWLSILETSFIIFKLIPYSTNLKKRLVKSPKIYFYDSAIVAYLTKHQSENDLFNGAMAGAFFEGLIVSEVVKIMNSNKNKFNLYFWRTRDGMEIDLILENANEIIPIEIKKTATPSIFHAKHLERFMDYKNTKTIEKSFIVCNIEKEILISKRVSAIPWRDFLNYLSKK